MVCGVGAPKMAIADRAVPATPIARSAEARTSLGRCHCKAMVANPVRAHGADTYEDDEGSDSPTRGECEGCDKAGYCGDVPAGETVRGVVKDHRTVQQCLN